MQEEKEITIPVYETIYGNDKTWRNNNSSQRHNENNDHASKARNRSREDIMDTTK